MNTKSQESSLKNYNEIKKSLLKRLSKGKQVYIIPSKSGGKFVFMNFTLLIIGLSYASNMVLIVTFLMVTFFILQMLLVHQIIQEIKKITIDITDDFSNIGINFKINFSTPVKENYQQLKATLLLTDQTRITLDSPKLINDKIVEYNLLNIPRGHYNIEKIIIHTDSKKSLFYVWRYFKIIKNFYSYPVPVSKESKKKVNSRLSTLHSGTFYEQHLPNRIGLNSKRIDWKLYARKETLYVKKFIEEISDSVDINYSALKGSKEEKLSQMSYLINQCYHQSVPWKITLPTKHLDASTSRSHYTKSLEAISVF